MFLFGSPFRDSRLLRLLVVLAAVACMSGLLVQATTAHAASGTVPMTVRNTSGSNAPMHLYLIGEDLNTGSTLGYVDAGGSFHPWPTTTTTAPMAAPDVSITGPKNGDSATVQLPKGVSGRLYYSIGRKLDFRLVRNDLGRTSLVQPAPWVDGDTNRTTLFDWVEFTFANGLWINSTQVDQFALPAAVSITGADGTRSIGTMHAGGRQRLFRTLLADPKLARTVVRDDHGKVLRALAPGHATRDGLMSTSYLNDAITKAWSSHVTTPLLVRPFGNRPKVTFRGRTVGNQLVFTNPSGATVARFAKPSSLDVFECAGALLAPNDKIVGPIARTLCAALNRGTLTSSKVEPVRNTAAYYRSTPANAYAKAVHKAMADGRAYAFPFDDVGQQESLVHANNPTAVTVTIPDLGGGV